jgi:hypothetical protein
MKRTIPIIAILFPGITLISQTVSPKLQFTTGQTLEITMQVKSKISQQAMGQAIDFNVDGQTIRSYKVTNATDDNNTLHHKLHRIAYNFDGMGQKRNFDSDKPKDLEGQMGKPIKDMLEKTYDMIIDSTGLVLMVIPEKIETADSDPRMMIIMNMLKDLLGTVQPPKKNEASFFKVLPEGENGVGTTWTVTENMDGNKSITSYKITGISEAIVTVEFTGNSTSTTQAEMMGMQTTTSMNNKTTGQILLDKTSGIILKKTSTTNSTGTTEVMGGTMPVSSTVTIEINVKPVM